VRSLENSTQMESSWQQRLAAEFSKPYMTSLKTFLRARKEKKVVIFPHSTQWFNAFRLTPFHAVKVVILGQDPYHGPGQAHGLSFSVPAGVRPPPSLLNIYKEIHNDLGVTAPTTGCLEHWATQGVFLLNSVLTVEQGQAAAHQGRGWEDFTDRVIELLSEERENLVFMLWGSYALKKGQIIDARRHLVLECPHPSPLSAHRGFIGCGHFSAANEYLQANGQEVIDWRLPAPEPVTA